MTEPAWQGGQPVWVSSQPGWAGDPCSCCDPPTYPDCSTCRAAITTIAVTFSGWQRSPTTGNCTSAPTGCPGWDREHYDFRAMNRTVHLSLVSGSLYRLRVGTYQDPNDPGWYMYRWAIVGDAINPARLRKVYVWEISATLGCNLSAGTFVLAISQRAQMFQNTGSASIECDDLPQPMSQHVQDLDTIWSFAEVPFDGICNDCNAFPSLFVPGYFCAPGSQYNVTAQPQFGLSNCPSLPPPEHDPPTEPPPPGPANCTECLARVNSVGVLISNFERRPPTAGQDCTGWNNPCIGQYPGYYVDHRNLNGSWNLTPTGTANQYAIEWGTPGDINDRGLFLNAYTLVFQPSLRHRMIYAIDLVCDLSCNGTNVEAVVTLRWQWFYVFFSSGLCNSPPDAQFHEQTFSMTWPTASLNFNNACAGQNFPSQTENGPDCPFTSDVNPADSRVTLLT